MGNDKPICGACEHWEIIGCGIGKCTQSITESVRYYKATPAITISRMGMTCFKLWEEK